MFFFSVFIFFWSFLNNSYLLQIIDKFIIARFNLNFQGFFNFYLFFKKNIFYCNNFFKNLNFFFNFNKNFLSFSFFYLFIYKKYYFFFIRSYWICEFFFIIILFFNKLNLQTLQPNIKQFKNLNNKNFLFFFKKNKINYLNFNKNFFFYNFNNYLSYFFNYFFKENIFFKNIFIKNININYYNFFLMKFLKNKGLENFLVFFLRKNRIFNKSRYSRNRQNFRTGVYWCLYVNILAVLGIYFFFYKFTINFSYLWWFFIIFINVFFFNKFLKLNIFSIFSIFLFFKKLFFWILNFLKF